MNHLSPGSATRFDNQFIVRSNLMRVIILVSLFVIALGIRVFGITDVPLNYHPVKQYRAALTARAFYYSMTSGIPEWESAVAASSVERIGFLGPPVIDFMAAGIYSIYGVEELWLPKLLSVIFWVVGGFFLYLIARRMMSEDAAIVSTSIYLLLPFGVVSSQSFQPDPLMLMLTIISIYLIVRHHEDTTWTALLSAGIVSAAAVLVKPVSIFIILGAYFSLQYHKNGLHKDLVMDKRNIAFVLIALLPSLVYYSYGILNTANLEQQAQKSFVLQLFLQFDFWDGWLKRIKLAVGHAMFLGGLLGAFFYPAGWQKKMVFGLWSGYFLMCFAFNYTISTHDYYHLPLFPIISLSLGPIAEVLVQNLRKQADNRALALEIWGILLAALFLSAGTSVQAQRKFPDYQSEIKLYEEVGEAVAHSTRTILLAPYDGKPLIYYGKLSGQYWPYWYDIRDEKLWGVPDMLPQERLKKLSAGITPEYFIITDLVEFENQADLKQYLEANFPVLVEDPRFIIYRMTTK
jgi:4-amino-4-deoxy-L-arabinose transferase-like glycosyltransferase